MTVLQQLPLLEEWPIHIAFALLHFLWQGALLGVVFVLCNACCQSASSYLLARLRYWLGCTTLLLMLTLPVMNLLFFPPAFKGSHALTHTSVEPNQASIGTGLAALPGNETAGGDFTELEKAGATPREADMQSVSPTPAPSLWDRSRFWSGIEAAVNTSVCRWVFVGWIVGICLVSVWHLAGWAFVQRIRIRGQRVPQSIELLAAQLANRFELSIQVTVKQSFELSGPILVGALRPVILLPVSLLANLNPSEIEAILAHELAHAKRHDYMVNLLQSVVETLLFYHPAVWWVSRRVRIEREFCTDEMAVRILDDRLTYAQSLAAVAATAKSLRSPALAASDGNLADRVRRLLAPGTTESAKGNRLLAAMLSLLLGLACVCVLQWHNPAVADEPGLGSPATDGTTAALGAAQDSSVPDATATSDVVGMEVDESDQDDSGDDGVGEDGSGEGSEEDGIAAGQDEQDEAQGDREPQNTLDVIVKKLNVEADQHPEGKHTPPVERDAILKAIRSLEQRPEDLAEEHYQTLRQILESEIIPETVTIRQFFRLDNRQVMKHGRWVRLLLDRGGMGPFYLPVSQQVVLERPFTQRERMEHDALEVAGGVMTLNRFQTYFDDDPKFLTTIKQSIDYAPLASAAMQAINEDDLEAWRKLFLLRSAKKPQKDFIEKEFKLLKERGVRKVEIRPRQFGGKLKQSLVFSSYDSNLPVEGYVCFHFEEERANQPDSLCVEFGNHEGKPRFACHYVTEDNSKQFLGKRLSGPINSSGFMADLGDRWLVQGFNISAPKELKFLEQANYELWHLPYSNR